MNISVLFWDSFLFIIYYSGLTIKNMILNEKNNKFWIPLIKKLDQ